MMSPVCFVRNDSEINTPAAIMAFGEEYHRKT